MTCYKCGEMRSLMLRDMCICACGNTFEYCGYICELYNAVNLALFDAIRNKTTTCEPLNKF